MPSSLKSFKLFTSKPKKKKAKQNETSPQLTRGSSMPSVPVASQTPPTRKRLNKTDVPQLDVRTSAPAAFGVSPGSGVSAATSWRSLPTSRSQSSGKLHVDEHKQLKEVDRKDEAPLSSDPDTSLFEYEDEHLDLTSTALRRSYTSGSRERLQSRASSESIDTIGMSHGKTSPSLEDPTMVSTEEPPKASDSLQWSIPKSLSPRHTTRGSSLPSVGDSLRQSLEASVKSRDEKDESLKQSVEMKKDELDDHVSNLATTLKQKPDVSTLEEKLEFYRKFEISTERTLHGQEQLIKVLNERIVNLEETLADYKKYKECMEKELTDLNESLTGQNNNLANLVYKLNQEISYCQTHHKLVTDPNGNAIKGLPDGAPTPAWMVDFKYLSPLIKSLEDQVAMKGQELDSLKRKFSKYEADITNLVKENESLRATLKSRGSDPEAIQRKTWSQLQEQALLVLEENEILLKKLDVQEEKFDQMHEKHYYELSELEDKMVKVNAERQSVLERLTDAKCQLAMYQSRSQELAASLSVKVDKEEHDRVVLDYKTRLQNLEEVRGKDKEMALMKLSDLQSENEVTDGIVRDLRDELRTSRQEMKRKEKVIKTLEEDCAALASEVKKGKDVLAHLLLVTDEAVHEKESMQHFLKSENKEKKKSVGAIIESELVKEKLVDAFKKYRIKSEQQLDKLMSKLEKQSGDFDAERREYERQMKHLRLLVHEKDVKTQEANKDKQDVEECLEFVWKATQSDNYDMANSLRRRVRESRDLHLSKFLLDETIDDVIRLSE
ncbi:centrosomal protein of 89 kDa-like isoform X2 [Watersipora subatra]|uniref:centrosomal protein of 89 kDa-like isoform X2 n=1 Tax=Watersipora subatra TaxID=2589382 RepID=UPI00355B1E11